MGIQYIAGVYPLSSNGDGTYSASLFGIPFADGFEFIPVGENQYIQKNNGMEKFVYIKILSKTSLTVLAILLAAFGLVSLANGVVLCYNTIKSDVKLRTKIGQYIWSALAVAYAVFIVAMQVYCFWKL